MRSPLTGSNPVGVAIFDGKDGEGKKSMHPAGFEPAPSNEDYDLNVAC